MANILHRIGIKGVAPAQAYEALTTIDGLAGWWTEDTKGNPDLGGVVEFRFPVGGFDMQVVDLEPPERLVWRVLDGPEEWIGTTVEWSLRQEDDYTIVMFGHRGWAEPVDFMYHCSTKWATFLMSLKALMETGQGYPAPRDVAISNWH